MSTVTIDMQKRQQDTERLEKVVYSLQKVNPAINKDILSMAQAMSDVQIIKLFNQDATDLFAEMSRIIKLLQKENECKVDSYKFLFETAIKINAKLPIDKFTLIILEYAAEIYGGDENVFLDMPIPDAKINVGNEFGLIRSEMFKSLWRILDRENKDIIKDKITSLTTYAHAYLYKSINK
ncbi:hypothetical protein mvi_390 [Megavirus vitis]|nr:hypothetical protein mvi_390 [Megavirus vitis]